MFFQTFYAVLCYSLALYNFSFPLISGEGNNSLALEYHSREYTTSIYFVNNVVLSGVAPY